MVYWEFHLGRFHFGLLEMHAGCIVYISPKSFPVLRSELILSLMCHDDIMVTVVLQYIGPPYNITGMEPVCHTHANVPRVRI